MANQHNRSLSDDQKKVLLDKATEPPFSGKLLHNKEDGAYTCANCDAVLFNSEAKFDSSSGWPSFNDPANQKAVKLVDDTSLGMARTEVVCANCEGHLGHLFNDAQDQPTGNRYCINSLSLDFKPKE